jgi:predicted phage terminase large subunit-like protein
MAPRKQPEQPNDGNDGMDAALRAAERLLAAKKARDSLISFTRFTMPDPNAPDDPTASKYSNAAHHDMVAEALERLARGEIMRLAISMFPQSGKSELTSRRFPAWFIGKFPYRNMMLGTYNQDFANDFGDQVRNIMGTEQYRQVFPGIELRKGSRAKDRMVTTDGGMLNFLGRGGSGTGKPSDLTLVDDPIKDDAEAQSDTIREQAWQWFTKVIMTRLHTMSSLAIIMTRWHDDDIIGRLTDPNNDHYDEEIAKQFVVLNIPAIFEKQDADLAKAMGKKVGDALWPERFSLEHLRNAQRLNKTGFSALYQGRPTPDDGEFFKRENLVLYRSVGELPEALRMYGASDHAVTVKKHRDLNVIGCAGVDVSGDIWVLPDVVWEHMETDTIVSTMIDQMKRHRPLVWWAENENITKSFGPFLRQQQREKKVHTYIEPVTPIGDKRAMARSAQGMTALRRVHFPAFAHWWPAAERELLKFDKATHDDFVSWLSFLCLGVDRLIHAEKPSAANDDAPKVGSIAWIKAGTVAQERRLKLVNRRGM